MNARQSNYCNVAPSLFAGALLALLSLNVSAESTLSVDARLPVAAILLPSVKVTASISDSSNGVRWNITSERELRVTLMPTVTVTADFSALAVTTLPTVIVIGQAEPLPLENSPAFAQAPTTKVPMLGVLN